MRYSLLSRFQGTFLGATLGEIYGSQYKERSRLKFGGEISPPIYPWSQIAALNAESLVRCGKIDLENCVPHAKVSPHSQTGVASCSQAAVALLPVALFFHENEATLQQHLKQASARWQHPSDNPVGVLSVGYAIAQALIEKLEPATLIPQILTYLHDFQIPLVQQLAQVQTLLEQKASLEMALNHLCRDHQSNTTPIALAFYCFLSTPEDFRLSVTRAVQTNYQPQITTALTGALSGVYNSLIGIPLGWRIAFNRTDNGEMLQLTNRLMAAWSGVYDATTADHDSMAVVAAPRVIQPRQGGF